ncbi:MAG: hypothetical protein ACXVAG_13625 [Vulcanimicrobiaceae bacterium]
MKFTRHRAILIAFALGAVRGCGGGTQDGALPAQPGFRPFKV